MSVHEHRHDAPSRLRFAVLTVSDTRTPETDDAGALAVDLVTSHFHHVTLRAIRKDDIEEVREWLMIAVAHDDVDVVVVTGGTGFAKRDSTFDAIASLYDPFIPGFGELFRVLSFEEIGPAAMLTRASAGVIGGTPVFSLPGSPSAVRLALTRLILPEAGHLVSQLQR